jgi:NitT/TauT family transport system permease protein
MAEFRPALSAGALPVGVALLALVTWEAGVGLLGVPKVILPPPSAVAMELAGPRLAELARHAVPSGLQILSGFTVAAAGGILLAVLMAYSALLRAALQPYMVALQVVPKIALAPLFILWFGIGFASRFAFATFICFFPVVIATLAGLRDAPPEVIRMCRAIGATDAQVMLRVRLPFAVPYIFAGLKIASTMAVIGVVIGEFISADRGLAYLILYAASRSETSGVLAAIAVLCAIGLALYGLVALAERFVMAAQQGER